MLTNRQVANNLRALADKYEAGYQEALNFDVLGDIFGNEFWNLLLNHSYDLVDKLTNAVKERLK
mgnify:CR=1 FL=1